MTLTPQQHCEFLRIVSDPSEPSLVKKLEAAIASLPELLPLRDQIALSATEKDIEAHRNDSRNSREAARYSFADAVLTARERTKPEPAPDPYAELKAAKANGEVIQLNWLPFPKTDWRDFTGDFDEHCEIPPHYYRIRPTPKLVPLTSDDLPPVVWVRYAANSTLELVYSVHDNGNIQTVHHTYDVADFANMQGSPDRKTWHSFMKEVEG